MRHNGEIINGDALQLYRGLPIVTNKLAEPHRKGIPHHLLDCVGLDEQPWTVRQYNERARSLIRDIRSRNKLPIVVGGTHYYVQSLIPTTQTMLEPQSSGVDVQPLNASAFSILNASTSEIFRELQNLDPATAARTHPNDRRKVQRGLEICLENGRPASQVYLERRERRRELVAIPSDGIGRGLSDDLLVFWTHATAPQLTERLNVRVDQMVSRGLIEEVEGVFQYAKDCRAKGTDLDESHGLWTAIGYKEFLPLLSQSTRSEDTKADCIERTKIATRQYAKRQNRWIRLTLIPALAAAGYDQKIYPLDVSDTSQFSKCAQEPALRITGLCLDGEALPHPHDICDLATNCLQRNVKPVIQAQYCKVCDKTLMNGDQWKGHLKSKGHRSAIRPKIDWKALHEHLNASENESRDVGQQGP